MPRVQSRVARKRYVCGRVGCGKFIHPGDTYFVAKPYRMPKVIRCSDHPPRASETTSSEKMSAVYAVQEELDDINVETYDDKATLADDVGGVSERAREAGEMFNESAQNIEDGFGHSTTQSEELEDQGSQVDSWADEISEAGENIRNIDGEDWHDEAADYINEASQAMPL